MRIGVYSVIETDWSDGEFVTKSGSNGVTHVIQSDVLRAREQIASVSKDRALEFAEDGEGILDVEDGEKLAAKRISAPIVRTEVAFSEAAHSRTSPIEEAFVD